MSRLQSASLRGRHEKHAPNQAVTAPGQVAAQGKWGTCVTHAVANLVASAFTALTQAYKVAAQGFKVAAQGCKLSAQGDKVAAQGYEVVAQGYKTAGKAGFRGVSVIGYLSRGAPLESWPQGL